ncbi:high affinity cationic amino acid transporter 1-like [Neocloeon triangulifer]|uniref:high affinity cationic amino acid transporter 1-like n=1 Tax=Neocloeon triangulifer TaxID=2078957 RepID=UPI00286F9202|nr:high affinity cationic amino acid transporter 1-like [Neocloeon triangulifer]XP_059476983.1 high affinity cationic amino acid transporter 1-like [Neocloeon triangulifer]
MAVLKRFYHALTRRKNLPESMQALLENSKMARVLTTLDLTALGVGSTLGVGVYVLAGSVSKETAGPAVVVSFIIAAIASIFAGLCYAEFGARVPKAGSAYVYSYVCVGEFVAFIIGWNLVLEYVVGSASVVRGLSGYVDNLFNNTMAKAFEDLLPIDVDFLSPYIDFFAFALSIVFAVALALGVKESSNFNNVFTIVNLAVVAYVIICGLFKVDIKNWSIDVNDIPDEYKPTAGTGGFAPFGINGIIKGAATCFYGFVGFDCVATTGEEAKNPQKAIPIAIVISLAIIAFAYIGVSTVLTLMWPYYAQDPDAPLPYVFFEIGWDVAAWIVSIGAIFGLCASLMGAMLPLPRVIYAMANDGIIFRFLGKIHPRFQTPLLGTILAGLLTGFLAAVFDLKQLVDMMSIGTLLAYSIVAACVLLLRYQPDGEEIEMSTKFSHIGFFTQLFNLKRIKSPSTLSANIVTWGVVTLLVIVIACGSVIKFAEIEIFVNGEWWAILLLSITGALFILNVLVIGLQPSSNAKLFFRVPLVPVIPALSIFINIYLMLMLDEATWIRFAVWMLVGFVIYFAYGIWQSEENVADKRKRSVIFAHTNSAYEEDDEKKRKRSD